MIHDVAFENFVHEVYVGNLGVGILAGQLDILQVGSACDQHIKGRFARLIGLAPLEHMEQIHEVCRRTANRLALVAVAQVHRAKERSKGG